MKISSNAPAPVEKAHLDDSCQQMRKSTANLAWHIFSFVCSNCSLCNVFPRDQLSLRARKLWCSHRATRDLFGSLHRLGEALCIKEIPVYLRSRWLFAGEARCYVNNISSRIATVNYGCTCE